MAGIGEVAARAGVSASTVSYVLSGKRKISEPTRDRVLAAVAELNYRPHAGARALASSQTNVLALIAPLRAGVDVSVIMQFVAGIVTQARSYDKDVLILTDQDEQAVDRVAHGSMADAVIVMDVETRDRRLPALRRATQPVVLIGLPDGAPGVSCIDFDFEAAGRLAVQHLHHNGARRLALIGSPSHVWKRGTSYAVRLRRGFTEAANELGFDPIVLPCEPEAEGAAAVVDQLLAQAPDIGGILVHNEAALPTILAEVNRRLAEPPPLLALGPAGRVPAAELAVIDIPGHAIGASAVDMAMARLAGDSLVQTRLVAPRIG